MAKVCSRCLGLDFQCPICFAPPRRGTEFLGLMQQSRMPADLVLSAPVPDWEVQGVDLSSWNGTMRFSVTHTKVQYARIRLGYGNEWKDSKADIYRQGLFDEDMPYGGYWFLKIGQNWKSQAENFWRVAKEFPFQLDLTADAEYTLLDIYDTLQWLINFDGYLCDLSGQDITYYSSAGWWDSHVARSQYFDSVRKWVASWTFALQPTLPRDWTTWGDWQHSGEGNGKGIEYGSSPDGDADMDLNRWNGTIAGFNAAYGTHIQPIGQIQPGLPDKVTILTSTLNIRSAPDPFQNNVIGTTTRGKTWNPIELVIGADGREWWRINKYAYIAKWLTTW